MMMMMIMKIHKKMSIYCRTAGAVEWSHFRVEIRMGRKKGGKNGVIRDGK